MKHLQNNFTTPEQSKRLLELGLPTDSADLYYALHKPTSITYPTFSAYGMPHFIDEGEKLSDTDYIIKYPCWSVGRLIEIYVIARGIEWAEIKFAKGSDFIELVIARFEDRINDMDFSKLED